MSSPFNNHDRKPSGENLVSLLPLHLQTIYQLRPSNTFHEGQMKLSENIPKLMGKEDDLQMAAKIVSPLVAHSPTTDLPLMRRNTLSSTSILSDNSKADAGSSISEIYSHRRSKNKILGASYKAPQSFIYNWIIPVNMEDIHAFVHSELITEQNIQSIIFLQRQIRLLRRSAAILRLLESAHRRALVIPGIIFRLWRIYTFITRMYRHILHRKVFSTWKTEMLFCVKHKQMEYLCNIFLQSKYFACFKERARINTQLNLFVVTFMKRINLRVTNDIFQFFLYLMKYLKTYRKQLKAFTERDESQANEYHYLQLPSDNPRSVYKELMKGMPIKFYDIAKTLVPVRSSYLIHSFVSDIQYRVQVVLYIRLTLLRHTLISPVFVAWLTTIRMLRIRKTFLLLTYDKLLITAFYRWSDLARGRHKLMTKYLSLWKQYIDKIRLQRYKILLANQFRVKSLVQTYLRRWEDYCFSKDIVRLMAASSLATHSGYASFFICTLYLMMNGASVYDAVNRRIVKKVYVVESYTEDGKIGYRTIEDDDGFLMIPGDVATKTLEIRKAKEEEAAIQRKESQLRNLFDAHIGSRQTRTAGSTFLTQHIDVGSDSEDDSIKRLVAPPPRKKLSSRGTPVPYCTSYHDEFCLKFRVFQVLKQRPRARQSFLRFILLLQASDRIYKQLVSLQLWKKYILGNKERLARRKKQVEGDLLHDTANRIEKDALQDIFLTGATTNHSDTRSQSEIDPILAKVTANELVSQQAPGSFVRLLFFKTHNLLLLTLLHKIAHLPSVGSVINISDFIPELDLQLFRSVVSKILSLSAKQLEGACYLTTRLSLGTYLSRLKTMQLFASVVILRTNFKYVSFSHQETIDLTPRFQVSTWDRRMSNLRSILSCCGFDTVYSLLRNYNKLQTIAKMETDLLEKYQSIEMDVTTMEQHAEPLETLVPHMLQEDIAVCKLFNEKQSMIKTILDSTTLSDNTDNLIERLKRERSYVIKDTTELTIEAAHKLLLFDAHASNSLLLKRLLDAVSTEISAGIMTKLEATLAGTLDNPRRKGENRSRVMRMADDLDTKTRVLKSALCNCFFVPQSIPHCLKNLLETANIPRSSNHILSSSDKYCCICSGCLCLYCLCAQRCRCMKNTIMRRSLIFTSYPAINYTSYKRIDSALVFLSEVDEDCGSIDEDYAASLSLSLQCFHVCGDTCLRHQIDKDCLRLLLMNNTDFSTAPHNFLSNVITTDSLETEGVTKTYATTENESEEPIAKVIVAHIQHKKKNKRKQKRKGKTASPKKVMPQTLLLEPASNLGERPAQILEDFELGKTADLLINYANRELIERIEVYKQVEGEHPQSFEAPTYPRLSIQAPSGSLLKNALLYTEVVFTTCSFAPSAPPQNVYLSLNALNEGSSKDYNDNIASIQRAQERLLSLELSEPVKHSIDAPLHSGPKSTTTEPMLPSEGTSIKQADTQRIYVEPAQARQPTQNVDKIQLESSSSKLSTTHDLLGRRYQVTISENLLASSTSNPSNPDPSAVLVFPLASANPILVPPAVARESSSHHSIVKANVSPRESSSTGKLVPALAELPSGVEVELTRGLSAQSRQSKSPRIATQDNRSEQHDRKQDEDSSEASLLAFFQNLPPDRESSSRSVLVSSQLKSREIVHQIGHQIDEELSRIASALPCNSVSSRPYSSEAGEVSLKDFGLIGPLSVAGVLADIDADLNGLQHSFRRVPSAPCNPSDSASRTIATARSNSTRKSSLERLTSQASSLPVDQETINNDKILKHTLQTPPTSNTSRRFVSAHSDNSAKDGHNSVYTAINLQLETVTDATSSLIETPISAIQQGGANEVISMPTLDQCGEHLSASDKILDVLQNLQSKFVDVEADSAEERVANLFKHLQEPASEPIDATVEYRTADGQRYVPSNITVTEQESTSDDELGFSVKPAPTIELLQLNMNLEKTISRQMQLRNSVRVASPRIGNKSVARLVHRKLLDELGNNIPRVDLSDNSVLRMQSGLIGTPLESMNVTELSINHQYSRLQHIERKVQEMVGPKSKHWKEQRAILQYVNEADDLNLSSSESLLRNEDDSFIIDLDSVDSSSSSSSLSVSDLILSDSPLSEQISNHVSLDMTELPAMHALNRDGNCLKRTSRPQILQRNKKIGKITTRYNKRSPSSVGSNKRILSNPTLKELNITCYNRILGEYKWMQNVSNSERTVSSADAYKRSSITRRSEGLLQEKGTSIFPKYKWKKLIRVTSSPAMRCSERRSIQKPKRRPSISIHLAAAKKEAQIHLPTLAVDTAAGIATLGGTMWNALTKSRQPSLLTRRTIVKHHRVSRDPILSPIFISSESSSTIGKAHIKTEYVSAWRKARGLKYVSSANLFRDNRTSLDADPDFSSIPTPKPIRPPVENMKDYIVSKIDANIFITEQQGEQELEQTQSMREISSPSTIVGDLPSSAKSSGDSGQQSISHVQRRNQELIRMLEECLLTDPITNRYSEMINVMSVNTSSLFELSTEQTSKEENQADYILIREFAKAAPRTTLQKYTDIEADTQIKKQMEQAKVELTTLSVEANSYCSPTTISMQNSAVTPTVIKKQLENDDPGFALTPFSVWGSENARQDHTYVASYPEVKMTDEEFHNIVLSQTFEVLSKAIQLAHGNKMITAQRCRESIEAEKMSVWEIVAGSRRSQSTRDLCSKNAQLLFSRAVRNALHQKMHNVDVTPIVRGFGLREGSPTPDVLRGGPDILSSLLRWRQKVEGHASTQESHEKAGLYAIQSHKLTKGEITAFQNSLWMSPGRRAVPLDVSNFKLVGSSAHSGATLKHRSCFGHSLANMPCKGILHHASPYTMKRGHTMNIGVLARACANRGSTMLRPQITTVRPALELTAMNAKPIPPNALARMQLDCTYFVSEEHKERDHTEYLKKQYSLGQVLRIHSKPLVVSDQRIINMKASVHIVDMNGRPLRKSPDLPPKPHGSKYGESPKSPRHEMGIRLPMAETSKKNVPRPVVQPLHSGSQQAQLLTVHGMLPSSPVDEGYRLPRESSAGYLKHQRKSRHLPGALSQIPTSNTDTSISLTDDENS
ncbi:Hypothetical protein GLP15_518 [Giardia lamblia P15]|uniref:Uncharacterized protein n=1 Tax=Giardia intestinalis (strain P15) TaxID=658858 RepID=E1F6E9_GIAIA|nr:Hypothetical protein GLP15_518 [Giardia lamblia P15]